jgi:hypothetical protein
VWREDEEVLCGAVWEVLALFADELCVDLLRKGEG